jgi:hypothetical protein
MNISNLEISFNSDVDQGNVGILVNTVVQCGCTTIPFKVNFEHGLVRNNNLSKFLVRNNLSLPSRFQMSYNSINNSWQQNFHFRGFSPNTVTQERWDIVFELQCTNLIGSIDIGREVWKLAIELFRKLDTGEDFDTRIMLGVYKEPICDTGSNQLSFSVNYDTKSDIAFIDPDSTIYQTLLFDNIGLFKTPSWIMNPDLRIAVSQIGFPSNQNRIDLTEEALL